MGKYIIQRLAMVLLVILGISFIIYFIMDLAPGNIVDTLYPDATEEQYERYIHEYGYDRSVFYRYGKYMWDFIRGDMGICATTKKPVLTTYLSKLPNTLALALGSLIVCHLISIPLGIISAVHSGSLVDNVSMVAALLGLSMPNFWLGLLLIILFSANLHWLPSGGFEDGIKSIILPAITIGTGHTAILTRTTRSAMIDVIRQDYLRTARAKGVSEKKVIRKHAFKNALIPILTISGTQLATSMGGAVLTETIFSWPGIGRFTIDSLNSRDTPAVVGSIILTTIITSLLLLIVDILYAYIDPRIKAKYVKAGK